MGFILVLDTVIYIFLSKRSFMLSCLLQVCDSSFPFLSVFRPLLLSVSRRVILHLWSHIYRPILFLTRGYMISTSQIDRWAQG